jgi:hypothetical protein
MKSLFATILAISTATGALPAIANSINQGGSSASQGAANKLIATGLTVNVKPTEAPSSTSASSSFAQGSLKIAKQIPADALGLLVFNANPASWQILATSSTEPFSPLSAINKLLSFLNSSQYAILKGSELWLGTEVAIAFLINPNSHAGVTFAALAPISDNKQYELFVKQLPAMFASEPTETLYQNVQILEWQLESGDEQDDQDNQTRAAEPESVDKSKQEPTDSATEEELPSPPEPNLFDFGFKRVAIAKLSSGYAVIASERQAIEKMIDLSVASSNTKDANSQPPLTSLADHPLFLRSLNNPLWNRSLLAGYGDYKGIGQLSEFFAADLPETSEIPGFNRADYIQGLKYTLSQYNSFDLFAWMTPQGIRSQSSSYFSEERPPLPIDKESRDRLLSYLPSNIYGAITSRNLNRQWQWFVEESKQQSTYKILVEGVRMLVPLMIGAGFDLDIEKDIISWIDGEYAVVVFPSDRSPFQETGIDLTIGALIRTSKPEVANATLAKLTKQLSKLSGDFIQVKKRQIGATVLTSFEFPDTRESGKTQSIFAYGWRDRQTLMLTLGANTASAFIPIPKPALAESEMFRDAISDMPQPNFGYFYLNVNAIAKQVATLGFLLFASNSDIPPSQDKSSQPVLPDEIKKVIDRLGGAVFVYSETSDRFQSDLFFGLKP